MNEIKLLDVDSKIITLRNQQVIIDCDVAELYGVETKDVNKAVQNNPEKFISGYIFELQSVEKQELVESFHRFKLQKHSSVNPKAFTEKGLYMLATILKSKRATETTIAIVETFAKLRELSRTVSQLTEITDKEQQENLMKKSGTIFSEILGDNLQVSESTTKFKLNLAVLSLEHEVKRGK